VIVPSSLKSARPDFLPTILMASRGVKLDGGVGDGRRVKRRLLMTTTRCYETQWLESQIRVVFVIAPAFLPSRPTDSESVNVNANVNVNVNGCRWGPS